MLRQTVTLATAILSIRYNFCFFPVFQLILGVLGPNVTGGTGFPGGGSPVPSGYINNLGGLSGLSRLILYLSLSLSLSQRSPFICGVIFYVCGRFSTPSFYLPASFRFLAYLSNHNSFSREHIFVGFSEFPSLVYWCIAIHHHRPQGLTFFRRVKWDFACVKCDVCTDTGPPVLSPIRED